jgi:hypothetical protein
MAQPEYHQMQLLELALIPNPDQNQQYWFVLADQSGLKTAEKMIIKKYKGKKERLKGVRPPKHLPTF